jgi:hypothetical protein
LARARKEEDMGRIGSSILDTNDMFPALNVHLVSEEELKLPLPDWDGYSVVLLYRGYW